MTETPRPDPWAQVRTFDVSTYGDCRMERDYYGDITSEQTHQRGEYAWVDEVDAARAADAARHQQDRLRWAQTLKEQHARHVVEMNASAAVAGDWEHAAIEARATVDRQAETIRQLQVREQDLENALVRQEGLKDKAEARCATLTAALKTARGYVVERLAQANKYDGPPRSGFVDYDLQQIDAALAAAPQGDKE